MQLLNPKLRHVGNDKSLLFLDTLWDIYALVNHNIKLSRKGKADTFLTYPVLKFNVANKVLVRNHTRDVWDLKDGAYHVVWVMGRHLKLMEDSGKTHKGNVQDVKITFPVNTLIKCLPNDKMSGWAAKYHAHLKHLEDLYCSVCDNVVPDIWDNLIEPYSSTTGIEQTACSESNLIGKSQSLNSDHTTQAKLWITGNYCRNTPLNF